MTIFFFFLRVKAFHSCQPLLWLYLFLQLIFKHFPEMTFVLRFLRTFLLVIYRGSVNVTDFHIEYDSKILMLEQSHYEILRVFAFLLCRVENWESGAFYIERFGESCIESFYFSLVYLLCTWRIHICSYPNSAEELLLLHMLTDIYCLLSFWYLSDKCEVIPCGFFDLRFSDDYHCWASFCILVHPYVFFGKMSIQFFCPFLSCLFLAFEL